MKISIQKTWYFNLLPFFTADFVESNSMKSIFNDYQKVGIELRIGWLTRMIVITIICKNLNN
jgi:hypothetical protein